MRFLMMTTFYPPYNFGGDGAYIRRLSHELANRGHEVEVVHCADAYHVLHRAPPPAADAGHPRVRVHTLRSRWGRLSPLVTQQTGRSGLTRRRLQSIVENGRFDVIHYHNMSLIGLDALELGEAVKLYTTHEHWLVCPMHVLWRNKREACERRTCFTCQLRSGRPPQWWRYSARWSDVTGRIDRFLCPSRFTLEKHKALGFDGPMTTLPYFLPRPAAQLGGDNSPHPRPYALFVGRLEKIKGVQNLLRLFRRYTGCDLAIVGDGAYEAELRQQAAGLRHVHFLGRLPYEQICAWYRHALTVVVPSICYEVFGIVILEGFAFGTPALVTPYGALPEVIDESGGGAVYQDDDELAASLDRLRNEPRLRSEWGERGRAAYLRLWSEEPHLKRYLSIVDQIRERRS